ncbi:hypothetical protein [Intestinimonas massiliensis (ex Afouda et al. 2020)]|jgi:hypothetical protein|uniref:Uncharacterized protein n=1 Tax=Intestinimonas massiliensis (ex Afouda et al. 2020) TaxID=1673721 RepID=A0ABS9M6G7_9FIRM|nr:hypothetical protein [Intestinimonas massiliensis (ex Afouda et al. 2020)]MCG4526383.1 hypothetical protein [Intestinimonas massiliensis (ex Afouda et al. 2020)]
MEFQVEIKRTQIAKLTFSVPDGDTEAAEEQAASLVQHAKLHPEVFDGCEADYDYALASTDPAGPVIFEFDD